MERRVLLAIFLSFLVLSVYQTLVVKPVPKPAGAAATPTGASNATKAGATPAPSAPTSSPANPAVDSRPAATALVGDTAEREVRIETRDVIAVFTNRGARLKSWRLKHFLNQNKEPLELIAADLESTHPLPFSLRVEDDDAVTAT